MKAVELKRQIDERDELIQLLTRQLEQAAEQLDRLQRSGGVSGRSPASLPTEFARQQEAIGQDVAYLVTQWENSQLAGAVGRIELQLEELRDLLVQAKLSPGKENCLDEQREATLLAKLQQAMHFSEQEIPEEELEEDPALVSDGRSIAGREALSPHATLPPLPQELDLEHAHPQQLCDAVRDRDLFIAKLVDQYRHLHQTARLSSPVDWQELNQAPAELRTRLEQLETQLQEQLRINEVSMSLERARLSREATQLELARMQLQKELKKHGLNGDMLRGNDAVPPMAQETGSPEKQRSQKWLSMLRIKET